MALALNKPFIYIANDDRLFLVGDIIIHAVMIIYLYAFEKIAGLSWFRHVKTSAKNVNFSIVILIISSIYLIVNMDIFAKSEDYQILPWYQIKVGVISLFSFLASVACCVSFSKVNIISEESVNVKKLENEDITCFEIMKKSSRLDEMTGCTKHGYGMRFLNETIQDNSEGFCVMYVDIDGLKSVNKKFGKDQGNEYICTVAKILKQVFEGHLVSRSGGGKFVIIMKKHDEFYPHKLASVACQMVKNSANIGDVEYPMSISYGLFLARPHSHVTSDVIINQVNKNMHAFKKTKRA